MDSFIPLSTAWRMPTTKEILQGRTHYPRTVLSHVPRGGYLLVLLEADDPLSLLEEDSRSLYRPRRMIISYIVRSIFIMSPLPRGPSLRGRDQNPCLRVCFTILIFLLNLIL